MPPGFGPLAEILWTEAERQSAGVMILSRKRDTLSDSDIADPTGVDRRCVYKLQKALKETRDPNQVISRHGLWRPLERGGCHAPSHLLRLASGARRTSIRRSWTSPYFSGSRQWQEITLGCGSKTQPSATSPTGLSGGSRTTAKTWSRRTAGLPSAQILTRWTILCVAMWRLILTDLPMLPRPPSSPPLRRTSPPWTGPW